jgi:uncharacterized delta-60 repeat protein
MIPDDARLRMSRQRERLRPFSETIAMFRKLLVCTLLAAASPALANDGLLDSSFGVDSSGRNVIPIDLGGVNYDRLTDTLVSADGSIFLIGSSESDATDSRYTITKLLPNGIVDPSFGNAGTVLSVEEGLDAQKARFDATGNILIAGSRRFIGTDRDFNVCRYDQMGQPVPFSAIGSACVTVLFDIPGGNRSDVAHDLIVEPNGKIVLVGVAGYAIDQDFGAIARLNPDGTLDTSFSSVGKRTYAFTANKINRIYAIARRADGKYIAVGETGDAAATDGTDALFARLTTNGALDPGYQGGSGYSRYGIDNGAAFNRDDSAREIRILGNGDMLMAGVAQTASLTDKRITFVYKIKPDDFVNADGEFGNSGVTLLGGGYSLFLGDMLVQSDGKIVLVTTRRPSGDLALDVEVIRLTSNGALDSTNFGAIGRTDIDFVLPGELDYGVSGAFQNGRLVIGGYSAKAPPSDFDLTVARLSNDLIFADGVD